MGLYVDKLSDGTPLPPFGKVETLIASEGAQEMVHPHYEPFVLCEITRADHQVVAWMYSRTEFMRFLNEPWFERKRWLTCEKIVRAVFLPDTIEEHLMDVADPMYVWR